jgi:hypothetical protein
MKKSVFAVVLLVAVFMASASFADTRFGKKGTWAVGGGADIHYETEGETFNISLVPSVSYFIIDNLTLGVNALFNRTSGEAGGTDFSQSAWGIAALVRYHYLMKGTLFLTGGASVGFYGLGASVGDADASASGLGFGVHAGPTIAFGGKFGGYFGAYAYYDNKDFDDEGLAWKAKPFGVMTELGLFF